MGITKEMCGMKRFVKPVCEIVRFSNGIIATSACPCYCDFDEFGLFYDQSDCTKDKPAYCSCKENHIAGTANCTPCSSYG